MKIKLNKTSKLGIFFILLASFMFLPKLLVSPSSLVCIDGEIQRVSTGYPTTLKGVKAQLWIKLKSNNADFMIFKNIGNTNYYPRFEVLMQNLREANTAQIWVLESEQNELRPDVYQIGRNNEEILYSLQDAKALHRTGFWGCSLIGLLLLLISRTKYGQDSYGSGKDVQISNTVYNIINIVFILILSYLAYLGYLSNSTGMMILFGVLALFFTTVILLINFVRPSK